jgi:hypothetical protein
MTLLSTKYNQANNWSARLAIAQDIWREVRAESVPQGWEAIEPGQEVIADSSTTQLCDLCQRSADTRNIEGLNVCMDCVTEDEWNNARPTNSNGGLL